MVLTNTKLAFGIITPLIGVLFFFFSLQASININSENIKANKESIEKMETKLDDMGLVMVRVQSNQAVLINSMDNITKVIDRIERKMEGK